MLPEDDFRSEVTHSSGSSTATVPFVPTGMKAGVLDVPVAVCNMQDRASPQWAMTSQAVRACIATPEV